MILQSQSREISRKVKLSPVEVKIQKLQYALRLMQEDLGLQKGMIETLWRKIKALEVKK